MGRRKSKARMIPEQDQKICGAICICQMTMVLSCVSFVYLSVAIYLPSHKAFNVGIHSTPVMCHTTNSILSKNCTWASCGEWCLTKPTGLCPQFEVTVRQNGTDIALQNCSRLVSVSCPPANEDVLSRYNCNNNLECLNLTGIFRCRLGHCANMSQIYHCTHKIEGSGPVINSAEDNLKLNGIFHCNNSRCIHVKKSLKCDRYCNRITTSSMNVYLKQDNNLYTGECKRAVSYNMANANQPPFHLEEPREIWNKDKSGGILFGSCTNIIHIDGFSLKATDCINGTIMDEIIIPQPYMNFSQFWAIYENSTKGLSSEEDYMPMQSTLTIYNKSRLYINLEGCVNTLRGECKDFVDMYGKNGSENTAESIFPCYYNKNNSFCVLARFDLNKTWIELMIAVWVPGALFIISFVTLMIITQTVKVGDDARMRCKWCNDNEVNTALTSDNYDENAVADYNDRQLLAIMDTTSDNTLTLQNLISHGNRETTIELKDENYC